MKKQANKRSLRQRISTWWLARKAKRAERTRNRRIVALKRKIYDLDLTMRLASRSTHLKRSGRSLHGISGQDIDDPNDPGGMIANQQLYLERKSTLAELQKQLDALMKPDTKQ